MAEALEAIVFETATVRILDQGANSYAAGQVDPATLPAFLVMPRGFKRVYVNSSTGLTLVATLDTGFDPAGKSFQPSFVASDPENTTDATLTELLRGLQGNNLTSKTGFAGWNVASDLARGGKDEAVMEITFRDNEGGSHVLTFNFCVGADVEGSNVDSHLSWLPTIEVVDESPIWT